MTHPSIVAMWREDELWERTKEMRDQLLADGWDDNEDTWEEAKEQAKDALDYAANRPEKVRY